jgi:hypothetical protein
MMRLTARVIVLVALVAASARAATKVAIVPLRDAPDAAQLEKALIEVVRDTPSLQLLNATPNNRLQGAKNLPLEARADSQPLARAQALGKETGAQRVLTVEAARIGDGRVLYLQAVDMSSGRTHGSTTAALSGGSGEVAAADKPLLRAAVVRVLDAARYLGRLTIKVDVPNAEVQVDGKKPPLPKEAIELPVGTHAVRVTHPAYRDFLRFVDLEFDKAITLDVALSAYPLAEGEMTEKLRQQAAGPQKKLPWYRTWWVLGLGAVVLTGAAVGVVYAVRPGLSIDKTVVTETTTPTP